MPLPPVPTFGQQQNQPYPVTSQFMPSAGPGAPQNLPQRQQPQVPAFGAAGPPPPQAANFGTSPPQAPNLGPSPPGLMGQQAAYAQQQPQGFQNQAIGSAINDFRRMSLGYAQVWDQKELFFP